MAHLDQATYQKQVKAVWVATAWLSVITVVEVVAALLWLYMVDPGTSKWLLNTFFIAASLLKAYFIVGEFMHVRYETRALALTILVPTVFLIWFIIAFLWEGTAWQEAREIGGVILDYLNNTGGHDGHGHGGH